MVSWHLSMTAFMPSIKRILSPSAPTASRHNGSSAGLRSGLRSPATRTIMSSCDGEALASTFTTSTAFSSVTQSFEHALQAVDRPYNRQVLPPSNRQAGRRRQVLAHDRQRLRRAREFGAGRWRTCSRTAVSTVRPPAGRPRAPIRCRVGLPALQQRAARWFPGSTGSRTQQPPPPAPVRSGRPRRPLAIETSASMGSAHRRRVDLGLQLTLDRLHPQKAAIRNWHLAERDHPGTQSLVATATSHSALYV